VIFKEGNCKGYWIAVNTTPTQTP